VPYAVIFPGQGAAVPASGEAWRGHASWAVVDEAETVLERPLARLLLEADAAELATTRASQLAVLLQSLVASDAFGAAAGERPAAFAGHSLGQVTSLLASRAVDRADGLRLAARRADLSQQSADTNPGRMAALVGADIEVAERVCEGVDAWVANDNAPGQVVIAGTPDGLDRATHRATQMEVRRVRPLDVGHAFHTPLLADAATGLRPLLDTLRWAAPEAPIVSNTDAVAYRDADGWPERLARHLVEPVRWRECQHTLAALGVDTLVEIGPGRVLAGLAKRTIPEITVLNVAPPDEVAEAADRLGTRSAPAAEPTGVGSARHSSPGPALPPPTEDPQ
jgi:[acyl-carrier-protein] S-malonyltransferase